MSTHYNIHSGEAREIEDATYDAWVLAGNPKADIWQPLPARPAYNSATQHPPEWTDGAWVVRDMTPEEIAAATRKVWPDTAHFWGEFTDAEAEAIAISTHPYVRRLASTLYTWRSVLFSDDPRVSGGLQLLEAVRILTPERRTAILAP
jgi:hypothetical protein